jgi:hypothetical protein
LECPLSIGRAFPAHEWIDANERAGDFDGSMLPAYTDVGAKRQSEYPSITTLQEE